MIFPMVSEYPQEYSRYASRVIMVFLTVLNILMGTEDSLFRLSPQFQFETQMSSNYGVINVLNVWAP